MAGRGGVQMVQELMGGGGEDREAWGFFPKGNESHGELAGAL